MEKYGFGVDVGGTTCKIGLFEMDGHIVEKWEIKTNTDNAGASILDDVADAVLSKMEERGISRDDVRGIGLGVPGAVDEEGVVHKCVNLGWDVVSVAEELSAKTGMYVKVANDANVAALGEMWQGGGEGCKDMVMVTLGTGVGGGIIINGKIVAGAHGAGGEIGHMVVNEDEEDACGCGLHGCLEQYTSATGIVRMAKKKMATENRETMLSTFKELTAKDIFDAAKQHDEMAKELVNMLCRVLGKALASIAAVADPEVFVIGGGVSRAGVILIEGIERYYKESAFHACKDAKMALATLGNDAGMYGCVRLLF
ncbi:MAG: ROK family glucokinase [Ruminococcus sp.]|mgnify:CR=1 FL=1|nr:ROK family glucokinase [Ruminococcus sp.]